MYGQNLSGSAVLPGQELDGPAASEDERGVAESGSPQKQVKIDWIVKDPGGMGCAFGVFCVKNRATYK